MQQYESSAKRKVIVLTAHKINKRILPQEIKITPEGLWGIWIMSAARRIRKVEEVQTP